MTNDKRQMTGDRKNKNGAPHGVPFLAEYLSSFWLRKYKAKIFFACLKNFVIMNLVKKIIPKPLALFSLFVFLLTFIYLSLIVSTPKAYTGTGVIKTWTTYNDFSTNSDFGPTTKYWVGIAGLGNPDNAAAGTLKLEANPSSKKIVVAEKQNNRLQVFSDTGAFLFGISNNKTWTQGAPQNYGSSLVYYFNAPADSAVDSSGNLYVCDYANARIQIFDSSWTFLRGIGNGTTWTGANPNVSTGSDNSWFWAPMGVAVGSSGNIYVADTANNRIQIFNSSGNFVRGIGNGQTWTGAAPTPATGNSNSWFYAPSGIAVDSSENIYVSDRYNSRIQIFDSSGNFLLGIGNGITWTGAAPSPNTNWLKGYFAQPYAVYVDTSGKIYVADSGNSRIQIFDSSGNFLRGIGNGTTWTGAAPNPIPGTAAGYFNYPQGIDVDSSGKIYAGDEGNHRIQIFDSSGNFVRGIGNGQTWTGAAPTPSLGGGTNWFYIPQGVTLGPSGNIYVADSYNSRIQKFDPSGNFLRGIGGGSTWTGEPIRCYQNDNGFFYYPYGVAGSDSTGYIYVADYNHARIQIFTASGKFIRGIGNGTTWTASTPAPSPAWSCTTSGFFNGPQAVAVDSSDNIYAVDTCSHVQIFNSSGVFLRGIGQGTIWTGSTAPGSANGTANSWFTQPDGIAVDSSGNIYVSDSGNHRVQKFDSSGQFLRGYGNGTTWTGSAPGPTTHPQSTADSNMYFYNPWGISVGASGNIYAANGYLFDSRIQKFDPSGNFLRGMGGGTTWTGPAVPPIVDGYGNVGYGSNNGYFYYLRGISVDTSANLYTTEEVYDRIQIFNSSGNFVRGIGNGTTWTGAAPSPFVADWRTSYFDQPYGVAVYTPPGTYKKPGTLGVDGSGNPGIGLRCDAGAYVKARWSSLGWNVDFSADADPTYAVKFAVRTSDNGSDWSGLVGPDGNAADWASNYFGQTYQGASYTALPSSLALSRYLEIMVRIESDGANSPTLSDVSLNYDTLDAPATGNLTQYLADGTTLVSNGGWTGGTVVLKADGINGLSDSTGLRAEFEVQEYEPSNIPFTNPDPLSGTPGSIVTTPPGASSVTISSGLISGRTYKWHARVVDTQGTQHRASAWTDYNAGGAPSDPDFKVDTVAPTGGSISYADGVTSTPSAVITLDNGTDALSGVGTTVLERAWATYTNDTVGGTWSDFSQVTTNPTSLYTDSTLDPAAGKAYKYRYVVNDNVGNPHTYTSGSVVKVIGTTVSSVTFTTLPSASAAAGVNFATQPAVTGYDVFGNVCKGATDSVTISAVLASNGSPGTGTLNGTLIVPLVNGVAAYSLLNYTKMEDIKLKATVGAISTLSNPITMGAAAAAKLGFVVQPSPTATAGVAFSPQPQVAVQDTYGNTVTTDNATKIMLAATAPGTDTLQGTNLTLPVTNGVAAFSGLSYNKAETMKILASATSYAKTQTSDTDFNAGTKTNTSVSGGSGSNARVILAAQGTAPYGGNIDYIPIFNRPYSTYIDKVNNKVYVMDYNSGQIYRFDSGSGGTTLGANWQTFGSYGTGANQFNAPYGVSVDTTNNKVYVADYGNHRICRFDSGSGGTTLGANWQIYAGGFSWPAGVSVDSANNKVYVANTNNNSIAKFDSGAGGTTFGANRENFGGLGSGDNQFHSPFGVFVDSANKKVYVADEVNNRIAKFDSGSGGTTLGQNWETLGTYGSGADQFVAPGAVFVDTANNKLYVADISNYRICRFDSGSGGTTLGQNWQTFGDSNHFQAPYSISVDTTNNKAYVADPNNRRICQFDSGAGGTTLGANWLAFNTRILTLVSFSNPYGVSVDTINNKVYVADEVNNRICQFDSGSSGTTLGANWQTFGSQGPGANQLHYPLGVFVDSANNKVYVADYFNNRICLFDSGSGGTTFGANWQAYGSYGTGTDQFEYIYAVSVDSANNKVYVADYTNGRIARFDSGGGGTTFGANRQNFGTLGQGSPNVFMHPSGVSVDTTNNKVYVLDNGNWGRICKFDSGAGGTTFGANWEEVDPIGMDYGICDSVAVDSINNKIYAGEYWYDSDWDEYHYWSSRMDSGAGGTTFGANREDAVGISGGIGVDTVNNKVIMTSPAGNTVYSFDSGSGASYYSSGTFESASIDLGAAANFNKLLWNPTSEPTNTSITVQAASSASSGGPWSYINLNNVTGSGGDIPASLNNNRYFRYKVTLATTNVSATPSLNDMTLNYSGGGNVYTPDTSAEVAVSPAAIHHYTVSATPGQHAGAGWTETVTAYDQYNNICTNNSSAQVTMTNDGAAQFFTDANYNIQQPLNKYPLSNGTVTIYIRDNTTQTIAITATDGNNKTGTSAGILVSPATTSQYSLNNVVSITGGDSANPAHYTITRRDPFTNLVTAGVETVSLASTSDGAAKKFSATIGGASIPSIDIPNGSSTVDFYYYDEKAGTFTITASGTGIYSGATPGTDSLIVNPNVTVAYFLDSPNDITAGGLRALYTLQRKDTYGNLVTSGVETVTLGSSSALSYPHRKFSLESGGQPGTDIAEPPAPTINIADGSSSAKFYYYDELMGPVTITASRTGVATPATDSINVTHATVDHLRFASAITTPQKVGTSFPLPPIQAVDIFGNIANHDYLTPADAYHGTKAITYTLSGTANAPNGTDTDTWTTSVDFTDGVSTTALDTTLVRAQTTKITASDDTLPRAVANVASNDIVVDPETGVVLKFTRQPSPSGTVNAPLTQQPIVSIVDLFENPTHQTNQVTLWASQSGVLPFNPALGTLSATTNPLSAIDGSASFAAVRYNTAESIYLYASCGGMSSAFSIPITFSVGATSSVEAAAPPQANFDITPTRDTEAEKFPVLKFKVKDWGGDSIPTKIDKIQIAIIGGAGAGGNASTDIVWAELTDGVTTIATATGANITNNVIVFGSTPNGDSVAQLTSVPENTSVEYTVNIYMKPSKLTAIEGNTYTFGIDESGVLADSGYSSQMIGPSGHVANVTGTIRVDVSKYEVLTTAGASSVAVDAGSSTDIKLQAVDDNRNIDRDYAGIKTFRFYGLNPVGGNSPTIGAVGMDTGKPITFTTGVSNAAPALTMIPYMKEVATVTAVDQASLARPCFALTATVSALAASNISLTSGNNQNGVINAPLAQPLLVTVKDTYGNPVQGQGVNFAVGTGPGGATGNGVNPASGISDVLGKTSTIFTMGNLAGDYTATATSGSLTGSPITFTGHAVAPTAMNILSGNNQANRKVTETIAPFVVQVVAGATPVPNVDVNFAIINPPLGATGQGLSAATSTTDINGQATTTLTLGDKSGIYTVQATYATFTRDFTVDAGAQSPYKVVLSGPTSIQAGVMSTAYTVAIEDQHNNRSVVNTNTVFSLTNVPSTTGIFYLDQAGNNPVAGNQITIPNNTSSLDFFYQDTTTNNITIASSYVSGQAGLTVTTASLPVVIIPSAAHHFIVTGSAAPMDAGSSKAITIKAYDVHNNIQTDYQGSIPVIFSGANPSPSPASQAPTVNDIAFNTATPLTFNAGVATATLKLYKSETALVKVTAGSVATADAAALSIIVKNLDADHLKFGANIPSTQIAGVPFTFETTIDAVDIYDNICTGANSAPAYNATPVGKTITYTLSGVRNGPETGTDVFVNPVEFVNGSSTTVLSTTLYRDQTTTITPSVIGLNGTNVASNVITVGFSTLDHLRFSQQPQQPSGTAITNVVLAPQPSVAVVDSWGNPIKSASGQVTLRAMLAGGTPGTYVPTTNGSLTGIVSKALATGTGTAAFTNITYNYPEDIYIEATVSNYVLTPVYSLMVSLATAQDATIAKVAQAGTTISSLATTSADKAPVLGFTIADAGTDGYATKIRQIVIKNTNTGTTANWTAFIEGAFLSDGSTEIQAYSIIDNKITFGSGSSVLYTINNSASKTYTLKLMLKSPLPQGADNEPLAFSVDVAGGDIPLDPIGSKFSAASTAVTDSKTIEVKATNFKIGSSLTQLQAGTPQEITLKAIDINGNIDEDYTADRNIAFSGASNSPKGNKPTVTVASTSEFATSYGVPTPYVVVPFAAGVNSSPVSITLYAAEFATVKAYEDVGPYGTHTETVDTEALSVVVNGGSAYQLLWNTNPEQRIVANAPWKEFIIAVGDAYGNTAPSSVDVTVAIDGGDPGANGTPTVTAVNGLAHFTNFTATATTYPKAIYVTGTAPGITVDTGSFGPIMIDGQYSVTLNVKDSVTNSLLPEVTPTVLQGATVIYSPGKGNAPFTLGLPYGEYTISLDKEKYVQENKSVVAGVVADGEDGAYDNNIVWTIYMTSLEEATADYNVKNTFVYDETLDKLTSRLWLERRGKLVLNSLDSVNKLGDATIQIFDEATNTYLNALTIPHPAFTDYTSAVYRLDLANVTKATSPIVLVPGKTYFARCTISYGGADGTGKIYETGTTFTITVSQSLKAVTEQISTLSGNIATQVEGVKSTVATEAETTREKVAEVKTETGAILTATGTTIPEKITAEAAAVKTEVTTAAKSEILNRENIAIQGSTIDIRYRTYEKAHPLITVYDPANVVRIGNMPMIEVSPGLYDYPVTFSTSWPKGDYSIVCQEPTYGTMDAITITIKTADIESVSSDVSAVLGSVAPIKEVKSQVDAFSAAFNVIEDNIKKASEALAGVQAGTKEAAVAADQMSALYNNLKEMSAKIHELGGTIGYDLEKLYDVSEARAKDIGYIRNKTQELKALLVLNQQMIENVAKEEPVVQTWFEFR